MNSLFSLVYTSKASSLFVEADLEEILAVSRRNNKQNEVSGFLSYRMGYFCQLLEGPEEQVLACIDRIKTDNRHHSFILHGQAQIHQRMMGDWAMARVDFAPGMASSESLIELFELAKHGEAYSNPTSLMAIVRLFSKNAKPY